MRDLLYYGQPFPRMQILMSLLSPRFHSAIEAVARACAVTRSVQHDLEKIQHLSKDDRSPVTVADFAAQAIIAKSLADNETDLKLIGEEKR